MLVISKEILPEDIQSSSPAIFLCFSACLGEFELNQWNMKVKTRKFTYLSHMQTNQNG